MTHGLIKGAFLIGDRVWGYIHNDAKKRWADGQSIGTSPVKNIAMDGAKPGRAIVTTENSTYEVEWSPEWLAETLTPVA